MNGGDNYGRRLNLFKLRMTITENMEDKFHMGDTQIELSAQLLEMAQNGNKLAEEKLIIHIRDKYMMSRISRYINRNRQAENEDIKQEFLIGVALAIPKARADIGNPIEFLIANGLYRVKTYVRKCVVQNTIQVCNDCGDKSRVKRSKNGYICKKCGSVNVTVSEISENNETFIENMYGGEFEEYVVSEMISETFKDTLQKGTRVYELYELMVEQDINRSNPNIKNYIQTLSELMGGCSTTNVVKTLNKLQNKYMVWQQMTVV